jgi:magnesium-transporting ATPase (P-type)
MRNFPMFRYDGPVREFPFSSATKWSGIVVPYVTMDAFQAPTPPVPQGLRLLAKGAPERCLSLCTSVWWTDSPSVPPAVVPLTQPIKDAITAAQTAMADAGLRTLALMYRSVRAR